MTVAGMKMEDPIPPPEEPPAYTSPEERAQVLEQTFAETQAQEQEEQLKELTEEKKQQYILIEPDRISGKHQLSLADGLQTKQTL